MSRNLRFIGSLAALPLVIAAPLFSPAPAAGLQPEPIAAPAPPDGPVVVRLHVQDADHLNAVAGRLDIWEGHREEGYVVAYVTPGQYAWLKDLGYQLDIIEDRTQATAALAALDPRYHYFDDYEPNSNGLYVTDFLQSVSATYPELTELIDIGDAWLADQPGEHHRDIWVLRISNEDPAYGAVEDKPIFFLFGTIHAREVAIPELAIRYIRYLLEGYNGAGGYGIDPDVTWLVNHHAVHILVMQNPDGHWINERNTSAFRRKNMNDTDGCTGASAGVDLNRNHSFLWGCCTGSSDVPCDATYRGSTPASEPETQAFQAYFASIMPDQNGPNGDDEIPPAAPDDATGIFISLHSYQDEMYWPWGFQGFDPAPNHDQLRAITRKFAYFNNYNPAGSISYDVDGATDDWAYGKLGVASFTFEVGPTSGACAGFFPAYGCIDGIDGQPRNFWAENLPVFLYAHKIAATPYLTTYGPDTDNVSASALGPVPPGTVAQLDARILDRRYGGDPPRPVAAAEFFVDGPGAPGTGSAMAPVDGAFDSTDEQVLASIDTTGLSIGRHYVLVRGQNDAGDWGPFTAAFLDIAPTGDFDLDGNVNLADHAIFATCLSGPGVTTPPPSCSESQFAAADLDNDQDVDTADFAAFETVIGQ